MQATERRKLMTYEQAAIMIAIIASFISLMTPIIVYIIKCGLKHGGLIYKPFKLSTRLMIFAVSVVLSVACLRFAVAYHSIDANTHISELIFNSLLQAFQTVGLDEDIGECVIAAKAMLVEVYGANRGWLMFAGTWVALLNIAAPISGGALIVNLLVSFFPKLKLKFSFYKKQFFFSKLNECSIALAESIAAEKDLNRFGQKPLLVFTDTCMDESSDLLQKARALGAICISDDITSISSFTFKEKRYFLIDENELGNIETFSELAEAECCRSLKKAYINVFYRDDSYILAEKGIMEKLEGQYTEMFKNKINRKANNLLKADQKKESKNKESDPEATDEEKSVKNIDEYRADVLYEMMPIVSRIVYQTNLIYNLLEDIPLFTPLLNRSANISDNPEFNLTVLGTGSMGMQMILNSSWCGQFYGYALCINVVSNQGIEDLMGKLDSCSPEILESTCPDSSILDVYSDGSHKAKPYFKLRYAKADLSSINLSTVNMNNINCECDTHNLLDSDYYLVALGSDQMNIAVAEKLSREIARKQEQSKNFKNVVITFVVYDKHLQGVFNSRNSNTPSYIRTEAFGSLRDVFGWQNVTMERLAPYAYRVNKAYRAVSVDDARKTGRSLRAQNIYNHWSSIARGVHIKYRVFSAFLYRASQNADTLTAAPNLKSFDLCAFNDYKNLITDNSPEADIIKKQLTWLEHRRWCAYMRANGYVCRNDRIKGKNDNAIKIHPCLVECRNETEISADEADKKDKLDEVSNDNHSNYKIFDTPAEVDEKLIKYLNDKAGNDLR